MSGIKTGMWQKTWGYAESIVTISAIVVVGMVLQVVVGEFDFYLLAYPANFIVAAFVVVLSVVIGFATARSSLARWFCDIPMSVALITAFTIFSVIMGLTLQMTGKSNTLLGFDVMTRHWAFVFVYFLILLSLGGLIVRRLKIFKWRDWAFHLNHMGLWLFLAAAGLGYADMERYVMYVTEGETEWRVYDENKNMKELPIAITLNDFDMDYYPPKLAIIDKETGDVLPQNDPQFFQIDQDARNGMINGWQIEVEEYIHQAVRSSDSTYREIQMPGSTPAVRIKVYRDDVVHSGWVCGGNQAQLFMTMPLDEQTSMVMTVAEPRMFTSDIELFTRDGKHLKAVLEVNKPLSVNNWTIYQYGYDNGAGRLSSYSSFELVYDSWLWAVYMGIIMMMLGSGAMVWSGKARKEKSDDME